MIPPPRRSLIWGPKPFDKLIPQFCQDCFFFTAKKKKCQKRFHVMVRRFTLGPLSNCCYTLKKKKHNQNCSAIILNSARAGFISSFNWRIMCFQPARSLNSPAKAQIPLWKHKDSKCVCNAFWERMSEPLDHITGWILF